MENLSYLRFHYAILPDLRISPLFCTKSSLVKLWLVLPSIVQFTQLKDLVQIMGVLFTRGETEFAAFYTASYVGACRHVEDSMVSFQSKRLANMDFLAHQLPFPGSFASVPQTGRGKYAGCAATVESLDSGVGLAAFLRVVRGSGAVGKILR